MFVILDSCGSCGVIGKSVDAQSESDAFNEAVIAAFERLDSLALPRTGELCNSKFSVITAARMSETTPDFGIPLESGAMLYAGALTWALNEAGGYNRASKVKDKLYADTNGDNKVTVAEAYAYAVDVCQAIMDYLNQNGKIFDFHPQVYPTNDNTVLFSRAATVTAPVITKQPTSTSAVSYTHLTLPTN